jgi:SAM-dependent methyltransferase
MDYRKPAVFGENWSPERYQVLPYFAAERETLARPDVRRILEIGCGNGWNMSRFAQNGRVAFGLDAVPERVALATAHGPALLADGLRLPVGDGCLDMVYVQHVLHHIGDPTRALAEARRVLRPGGVLFLVETVEDNPLIRWGGGSTPNGWAMRSTRRSPSPGWRPCSATPASACRAPGSTASSSGCGKCCPISSRRWSG